MYNSNVSSYSIESKQVSIHVPTVMAYEDLPGALGVRRILMLSAGLAGKGAVID